MDKNKKLERFVEKAKQRYGNKYDYSKVDYKGVNDKVCIICPKHGEFWQTPQIHLCSKYGCPLCGKEESANKQILTTEEFIKRARKIHGDKYNYSKVEYKDTYKHVCIICPEHGEFWQKPVAHLRGRGCPECGKPKNKTTEEFVDQAKKLYSDKYSYSKTVYVNNHTNVIVTCPVHGDFSVNPNSFLSGNYCALCKQQERFIKKAKEVHGNKYDYSKVVYNNYNTPVCIIDKERGEFWQTPANHLKGHGYNVGQHEPIYTYDYCKFIAEKYQYMYDFYEQNKKCYQKCKKCGWLDDFNWLKIDSIWTNKSRLIYAYEFDDNHVYVGLTNCLERRDRQHRGVSKYGDNVSVKQDSLYNYCLDNHLTAPEPKIIEDNLTLGEAKEREKCWISKYFKDGWILINQSPGGSVGALPQFAKSGTSIEQIIEEAKQYKSGEDIRKRDNRLYRLVKKYGLGKICFPNNIKRKPYVYTDEFIESMVKKYPLKKDLRKYESGVHQYLWEHGLLDKYYPKRLFPLQENFKKTATAVK